MRLTYNDLLEKIQNMSESQRKQEVLVGFPTGLVGVRSVSEVTDATDVDELDGNTTVLETFTLE